MTDTQTEPLFRLSEAARLFPRPPGPSTLFRWTLHGVRGHKLDSELVGGVRYTSAAAVQRLGRVIVALAFLAAEGHLVAEGIPSGGPDHNSTLRCAALMLLCVAFLDFAESFCIKDAQRPTAHEVVCDCLVRFATVIANGVAEGTVETSVPVKSPTTSSQFPD